MNGTSKQAQLLMTFDFDEFDAEKKVGKKGSGRLAGQNRMELKKKEDKTRLKVNKKMEGRKRKEEEQGLSVLCFVVRGRRWWRCCVSNPPPR
jgi:hypothetical protein